MNTCAIIGHRPTRFRFKYQENNTGCKRLKKRIHDQFISLYNNGVRRFLIGGSLGVDIWSGEILLKLKEQPEYGDIELVLVLPYPCHDAHWDQRNRARLAYLLAHCAEHVMAGTQENAESYDKRNRYIIDHADCLLAVYDNDRSVRNETGQVVQYAEKKGKAIILIHPDTGIVSGDIGKFVESSRNS